MQIKVYFLLFAALYDIACTISAEGEKEEGETDKGEGIAFADSIGHKGHHYFVVPFGNNNSPEHIVDAEDIGGVTVNRCFPTMGIVDLREDRHPLPAQWLLA